MGPENAISGRKDGVPKVPLSSHHQREGFRDVNWHSRLIHRLEQPTEECVRGSLVRHFMHDEGLGDQARDGPRRLVEWVL